MSLVIFNIIIDGEVDPEKVQKLIDKMGMVANILSTEFKSEPFKSLHEKYADKVEVPVELKSKDDWFFYFYLLHKLFEDYLKGGGLKGLIEDLNRLKIKKEEILDTIMGEDVKEGKSDKPVDELASLTVWTYKTPDLLSLLKKFEVNSGKEYEAEYLGLKVYVAIRPDPDELGSYAPYVFLTDNKPRLGLAMGRISIDPYETNVTQLTESRQELVQSVLEEHYEKLTLKSKTEWKGEDIMINQRTYDIVRALRYSRWALKTVKLSFTELVNSLPLLLSTVNDPKSFLKFLREFHDDAEKKGINLDVIKKEVTEMG
ncbi:hypothetical protein [Stygiolobus caldivivus]|uniref:Uncharacterized protein n=1 Tax=Stygiolobus caldivivus TaxID=2824673 RepID=A0A8D5U3S1_9CREN|nr:hypothetical protein [Stygiolobus caldivivus]BCU68719.1 hypothetical protein KN1_00160 [Stygiolobus caldivivus]